MAWDIRVSYSCFTRDYFYSSTVGRMVDRIMTFQIVTQDGRVMTVHTETGQGLTRVLIDEKDRHVEHIDQRPIDETKDEAK
jgi:hypothetical protein